MRFSLLAGSVLILGLVLMPATSCAQLWGLRGGVNMNKLASDEPTDWSLGYHIGLTATDIMDFYPRERLFLAFEMVYARMGAAIQSDATYLPADETLEMDYIQLPLMVRLYLDNAHRFYGLTGLSFNLLTGVHAGDESLWGVFKKYEFSLPIGAGVYLSERMDLSLKYHWGLTNIAPDELPSMKQSGFFLSLNYSFDD
jgi:hypothetical protein